MSDTVRGALSVSVTWTCPKCRKTRTVSSNAIRVDEEERSDDHLAAEFDVSIVVHCGPCDQQYEVEFA